LDIAKIVASLAFYLPDNDSGVLCGRFVTDTISAFFKPSRRFAVFAPAILLTADSRTCAERDNL
jgi:hypothetical protein